MLPLFQEVAWRRFGVILPNRCQQNSRFFVSMSGYLSGPESLKNITLPIVSDQVVISLLLCHLFPSNTRLLDELVSEDSLTSCLTEAAHVKVLENSLCCKVTTMSEIDVQLWQQSLTDSIFD